MPGFLRFCRDELMTRVNRKLEEQNSLPVLRDDLVVNESKDSNGTIYAVKDPATGSTYEFGPEEWFLLQQMNGSAGLDEIIKRFKKEFKQDAPQEHVEALIRMVTRWGLFKGSRADSSERSNIVDLADVAAEAGGPGSQAGFDGGPRGRRADAGAQPPRTAPKKWTWKRYTVLAVLLVVMFLPYPYDTGGEFMILPQQRQDIYAEIEGAVEAVFFNGGETVSAGTVLAQQISAEEKKNLLTTEAAIREQQAKLSELLSSPTPEELTLAQQKLDTSRTQAKFNRESEERLRPLSQTGDISVEDYEDARRKAEVARMEVLEAEANLAKVEAGPHPQVIEAAKFDLERLNEQLKYYKDQLEMARLVMPFDGRIVTRNLGFLVGNYLDEGDLFAVAENDETVIVEVEIPETDIADLAIGARVKVKVWAYPSNTFEGSVTEIAATVEEEQQANVIVVTTQVPNLDGQLRAGMTGYAKIDGGTKPVIVAFTRMFVHFFQIKIWSWLP